MHRFDTTVIRRFKQEFRTLADLRHRNIVRFHELFELEERLFFSMELIDGVDLLSWIWGYHEREAHPPDDALFDEDTKPNLLAIAGPKVDYRRLRDVFGQLVEGLAILHAVGTLHRDLKPSNLMVRRDGRLSILDFGLAVSLLSPRGQELEAAVGTIAYMAPEVAERHAADARSDYYSIGVLLFEALTGRTPFPGDRLSELLAAKLTEDAPAVSSLVPDVPPDLDRLCGALLQRDPALRAGADELRRVFRDDRAPAAESSDRLARGSGAIARPPVVGRHREVEQLAADLAQVKVSGMQCRLVIGPSGIGKSALADAFARRMASQATVLLGRCHDREAIPFRAVDEVVDALAHHLAALPEAERAQLVPRNADLLAELFPVLRGLGRSDRRRAIVDRGMLRVQSFAALRELFAAVGRRAPLVVVIDDLHLADPDSLDLLDQVFRGVGAPPLLLIGLGRPGSVMDEICRLAVKDGGCLHHLELGPLQGEEAESVARTLATYMDIELPDPRSVAIDTRGHPGFTLEVLRAATSEQLPALESVLAMRILGQPESTKRVLELLSVAGGLCSVELVADVLGYTIGEVAGALDDLVDADLVVATGRSSDDAFEFYHERTREVAEASLSAETVVAINHALAESLERRGELDPVRLLRYWQLGGEPERAAHYRTILAARAVEAYEFQRAAQLLETSLRDPLSRQLECQIRTELATVYGYLGRLTDSATECLAASKLTELVPALELQRRAAEALLHAADAEAGSQLIEDVLATLGRAAPQSRLRQVLTSLKSSAARAFHDRRFVARHQESVPARQSLTLDALATAAISVSVLEPLRGRVYQQRHLEVARQVGDRVRYARALSVEAAVLASTGRRNRARVARLLDRADEVAPADTQRPRSKILLGRGMSAFLLGEFASARSSLDQCLSALEHDNRGVWWELRQARCYASWSYWMTGDYLELGRKVPAWAKEAQELGDRFTYTLLTTAVGNQAWLLAGDLAGAEQRVQDAERTWSLRNAPVIRWHLTSARANLELYRGDPGAALDALRATEPVARRAGLYRVELLRISMTHLALRTRLAMAAAAPAEATVHLDAARALARALTSTRAPWAGALAKLATAAGLEHAGRRDAAVAAYRASERALRAVDLGGYASAASWRAAHLTAGAAGEVRKDELGGGAATGLHDPARFYRHLLGV